MTPNHVPPPQQLIRCPQCGSDGCGPIRCRFTMKEHPTGVARDAVIGAVIGIGIAVLSNGWLP